MNKARSAIDLGTTKPLKIFSPEEAADLAVQWMNAFCANMQNASSETFMWHVFSGGNYPSVRRAEAIARYEEQVAPEYIVLSNDRIRAIETDSRPAAEVCARTDYYVFPRNLAWTMAFTHEAGWLGPYFAAHRNYEALNKQNLSDVRARSRKRQEAENARRRGWK
ncbi:MAG: DUF4275 family protein [Betaproteobacteria bacterium]|nr:DUF4275 family protein [Betaproteobacteria bacterium]